MPAVRHVLMVAPPLAHFGHWYFQILYAVPVVAIVVALKVQGWRERRRSPDPAGDERPGEDEDA